MPCGVCAPRPRTPPAPAPPRPACAVRGAALPTPLRAHVAIRGRQAARLGCTGCIAPSEVVFATKGRAPAFLSRCTRTVSHC
eukprot:3933458-Prymnesium_polylepis.1